MEEEAALQRERALEQRRERRLEALVQAVLFLFFSFLPLLCLFQVFRGICLVQGICDSVTKPCTS